MILENEIHPECAFCSSTSLVSSDSPLDYEYGVQPPRKFLFFECNHCQGRTILPRPSIEELHSFYPKDYHAYQLEGGFLLDFLLKRRNRLRAKHIQRLVGKQKISLFDVGPGVCRHFTEFAKYGDFEFAGVELNSDMVRQAKNSGYEIEQGTLEELDISSYKGKYDVVTMYNLLEHVLDPQLLLQKSFDLLKPGGYILGQLPSTDCIDLKFFGRFWSGYHFPRHLQLTDRKGLINFFKSSGFDNVSIKRCFHVGSGLSLQNVLVDKGWLTRLGYGRTSLYWHLIAVMAPLIIYEYALDRSAFVNFYAQKPAVDLN
jgi:SAM-dependent methyltransferase